MTAGRPSQYDPERHPLWAEGLAKLGKTNDEISLAMGIARSTFIEWQKKHPEFSVAIKIGKSEADTAVEAALYKRAIGYDIDIQETTEYPDGGVQVKKTRKHVPPDPTSQIFWLKNRKPEEWRDKVHQEITGKDGGAVQILAEYTAKEIEDEVRRRVLGKCSD